MKLQKGFLNLGKLVADIGWANRFGRGLVRGRTERGLIKKKRYRSTSRLRGIKVK